jgi:AraC-like DNA-binding protein
MQTDLGNQLTIDDLARAAMFSKFHFCRLFLQITGLPPGRFLAALRLVEAKRLLVSTSLSVTEISNQVGYSSVGTFSYRFKNMVGESPSFYRQLGARSQEVAQDGPCPLMATTPAPSSVRGEIQVPPGTRISRVFIGLFSEPVPQGRPIACTVLDGPGSYTLTPVPQGHWYLMACARVEDSIPGRAVPGQGPNLLVTPPESVWMEESTSHRHEIDLPLRPKRPIDTPVLLAFPDIAAVTNLVDRAS